MRFDTDARITAASFGARRAPKQEPRRSLPRVKNAHLHESGRFPPCLLPAYTTGGSEFCYAVLPPPRACYVPAAGRKAHTITHDISLRISDMCSIPKRYLVCTEEAMLHAAHSENQAAETAARGCYSAGSVWGIKNRVMSAFSSASSFSFLSTPPA